MGFATENLRALFRDPDYLRVWLVGLLSGVCRFLEMLVVGIFAFELTGSPFLVALLVILRLVPLVLFGSVIGTLADRGSPRLFLLGGMAAAALITAALFATLIFGIAAYWAVAATGFGLGVVRTMDMPLRRRILGDIAGPDRLVAALSFDSATNNSTRMIGPLLGGVIYQWLGPAGAFGLMAALYAASAFLVVGIRTGGGARGPGGQSSHLLHDIAEGLSYAVRNRNIRYILLTTVVFNLWALPFLSMIPVIGADELRLSPGWVGALAGMEGAGAFVCAVVLAVTNLQVNQRHIFFFGVVAYVSFAFAAAATALALPMAVLIFCVGLGSGGYATMLSTLVYTNAPANMRSRLFGIMTICIGTGLLGVFNIGLMGELFGASGAVMIVTAEGFVALVLIALAWSELWQRRS